MSRSTHYIVSCLYVWWWWFKEISLEEKPTELILEWQWNRINSGNGEGSHLMNNHYGVCRNSRWVGTGQSWRACMPY